MLFRHFDEADAYFADTLTLIDAQHATLMGMKVWFPSQIPSKASAFACVPIPVHASASLIRS